MDCKDSTPTETEKSFVTNFDQNENNSETWLSVARRLNIAAWIGKPKKPEGLTNIAYSGFYIHYKYTNLAFFWAEVERNK